MCDPRWMGGGGGGSWSTMTQSGWSTLQAGCAVPFLMIFHCLHRTFLSENCIIHLWRGSVDEKWRSNILRLVQVQIPQRCLLSLNYDWSRSEIALLALPTAWNTAFLILPEWLPGSFSFIFSHISVIVHELSTEGYWLFWTQIGCHNAETETEIAYLTKLMVMYFGQFKKKKKKAWSEKWDFEWPCRPSHTVSI